MAGTYNILPSKILEQTDRYGNVYQTAFWNRPAEEIVASLEVTVSRKVDPSALNNSYPYPIPKESIPGEIQIYLQPSLLCQSDDPTIKEQAEALAKDLSNQVEVVNKTILWISQNIQWKRSRERYDSFTPPI